jgi:5-hydroxyisourate hydrolase-like protein (transthyretin family)
MSNYIGDIITLTAYFTDRVTGLPADPNDVVWHVQHELDTPTTTTQTDNAGTIGTWQLNYTAAAFGLHQVRIEPTVQVVKILQDQFYVERTNIYA